MRRVAALLLAVLLVAAPGAVASGKTPAAAKRVCVVKVVKKATKTRKAVRKKVCRAKRTTTRKAAPKAPAAAPRPWIPAVPTPAPAAAAAPASGAVPTPSAPALAPALPATPVVPVCEDDSPWLGAIADEDGGALFRLDLTRDCVRAGRVIVRYVNSDQTPHNLYARGIAPEVPAKKVVGAVPPKSQDTEDPAGQRDGEVQLTAGAWQLYCALPGHEVMTRDLTVSPPG